MYKYYNIYLHCPGLCVILCIVNDNLLRGYDMRIKKTGQTVQLWLSANDTYDWAHKPGAAWPCSVLSGHRLFAEFNDSDLVDMTIDGRSKDCPADEFNAITSDFLGG